MTKYLTMPERLLTVADKQAGAVSRAQCLATGVSDTVITRLVSNGDARRLANGVLALREPCWLQNVWAGLLLGGDNAVVGGLAAASLNGLLDPQPIIDIFTPASRTRHNGPWQFHRLYRSGSGSPPHTDLEQTLVDLAGVISNDQMVSLLVQAYSTVNTRKLLGLLAQHERHPGRTQLTKAIADFDSGVMSVLESRYVRQVERPHKLPTPTRQGRPLGEHACDVLYEEYQLIVELDGRRYHEGLVASGDATLDNRHLLAGYATMRFGWMDVTKAPCRVAREIAAALTARGWTGRLRNCPACALNVWSS